MTTHDETLADELERMAETLRQNTAQLRLLMDTIERLTRVILDHGDVAQLVQAQTIIGEHRAQEQSASIASDRQLRMH